MRQVRITGSFSMAQALPKPEYRRYAACIRYACLSLEYSGIHGTDMLVLFDACDRYCCFIGLHAVIATILCCNLALCVRHDTGS